MRLVAGSKYEVTILVASVIPAEPSPWANNAITQNEKKRVNTDFNKLIFAMMFCFVLPGMKNQRSSFTIILNSLLCCGKPLGWKCTLPVIFFLHAFKIWFILRQVFFLPVTKCKGLIH
jgi:hypothetical protein